MDPDPGGPKTCGFGSGSATLVTIVFEIIVFVFLGQFQAYLHGRKRHLRGSGHTETDNQQVRLSGVSRKCSLGEFMKSFFVARHQIERCHTVRYAISVALRDGFK
jgi:hypothetical protein